MPPQFNDRLPGTSHVQDLDVRAVHMEGRHIILVRRIECDPQQRRGRWACRSGRVRRGRWYILGRRCFVQNGRMLQTAQIEGAQASIGAHRHEDVCRARQPSYIVHLSIVGDELGHSGGRVDIPDSARGVDGCSHDEIRGLLVP